MASDKSTKERFADPASNIFHSHEANPTPQSPESKSSNVNDRATGKNLTVLETSTQSSFNALWSQALNDYIATTKRTSDQQMELKQVNTIDDLQRRLERHENAFTEFRGRHSKVIRLLKIVLKPFIALSDIASSALSLTTFAPASVILGAVLFIFKATDNVSKLYDCLEALFGKLKQFSGRLAEYVVDIPPRLKDNALEILKCLLEILGYSETVIRKGRIKEYFRNMFSDVKVATPMEKLETLFDIEQKLTVATTLGHTLSTSKKVENIERTVQDDHRDKILQWLSPTSPTTDFSARQKAIINKRQQGTGQWFLEHPQFTTWLGESKSSLFCHGIAGAGKSTLAATTIDHILKLQTGKDIGLAYLFCNHKDQLDTSTFLSALLGQLVRQRSIVDEHISRFYDEHMMGITLPSPSDYFAILQTHLRKFVVTYLVFDSIDECSNQDSTRDDLLTHLRNLQQDADLRLMFTSRSIPTIMDHFRSVSTMEIRADPVDLRVFVRSQRNHLPAFVRGDDDLMSRMEEAVSEGVGGMFLLARLYMESFRGKRSKALLESALSHLKDHSQSPQKLLDDAYGDAIMRIEAQTLDDISLAKLIFSWITLAQRSLTTTELCHALAVHDELADRDFKPKVKDVNTDYLVDIEYITSVCAGLVTIDDENKAIRLIHATTQEYFQNIIETWNPSCHKMIASTSLTYLSFEAFKSGSCSSEKETQEKLSKYPLLAYAARYWGHHTKSVQKDLSSIAATFLQDSGLMASAFQIIYESHWQSESPQQMNWLHMTARFGLLHLSELSLHGAQMSAKSPINLRDTHNRTPISYAAEYGHEDVVKLLLEQVDVEVNIKNILDEKTPLCWAAENGHDHVVKLLLERADIEINTKEYLGATPLMLAALLGHEAVVRLLLARSDIDVNAKSRKKSETALMYAAFGGHLAVVKLLLDKADIEVNARNHRTGETALIYAGQESHDAVVRLLLQRDDIEVDGMDWLPSESDDNGHQE